MKQAPGILYQGQERRKEKRCKFCGYGVNFGEWKYNARGENILMIVCTKCKEEFPARREEDHSNFAQQRRDWNGG